MHRKFIAAVAAAALAITGLSAVPARADVNDTAKIIAGIAALALIAKAIEDSNDRKAARQQRYTHRPVQQHYYQPGLKPRPLPHQVARPGLPDHCLFTAQTAQGPAHVFGARCLQRNYVQANTLPEACAQQAWTDRGQRWVYNAACLRNQGYRLASR
jgi:hypothetical protein